MKNLIYFFLLLNCQFFSVYTTNIFLKSALFPDNNTNYRAQKDQSWLDSTARLRENREKSINYESKHKTRSKIYSYIWKRKKVTFCPSAFLSNRTQYATTLKIFQTHQKRKKVFFSLFYFLFFSIKSAGKFVSVCLCGTCAYTSAKK